MELKVVSLPDLVLHQLLVSKHAWGVENITRGFGDLLCCVRFKLVDGTKHMVWGLGFEDSFSTFLSISQCKNALVAEHLHISDSATLWKVVIRPAQDWEVELTSFFFNCLYFMWSGGADKTCWIPFTNIWGRVFLWGTLPKVLPLISLRKAFGETRGDSIFWTF